MLCCAVLCCVWRKSYSSDLIQTQHFVVVLCCIVLCCVVLCCVWLKSYSSDLTQTQHFVVVLCCVVLCCAVFGLNLTVVI